MKAKSYLISAGVIGYAALALYGCLYLASALYFVLIKSIPQSIDSGTFISLWQQLSDIPAHRAKLLGAALMSAALLYLGPPLAFAGLSRKARSLHGNARFAYPSEVRAAGLTADKGILVGQYNGKYMIFGGQQFVLLAAPTRSGKGVGVVIPNLLNWPDSLVVLDIKLENFERTSGFRAQHGQQVFLFNPFCEEFRSHRWNPLSAISRDTNFCIGDIQAISATFYPSGSSATNSNEAFFNDQAQSLFMGIVLYLLETPELPCTMGEVFRQGSGNGQALDKHLRSILTERSSSERNLSLSCINAFNRFLSNSENTLSSIKATFEAPLLIFANPIVDAATSGDDFDLRDLRRKRMSIYLGVKEKRLESASRLLNLFFSQLVNLNTDKLPEQDPSLKFQTLLIMDEFTSMGRVSTLAKSVAFLAGYNLRLLPIVQSTEQIENTYGKETARNFIKNHDLQIVFPPDDMEDAEKVSRKLGFVTEKSVAKSEGRTAGERNTNYSRSENTSEQRRALLLAQEIREMPKDQQIIFKSNCKPILCNKIRYYDDPTFTVRLLPPLMIRPMDMDHHRAVTEQRIRAVEPGELSTLDVSKLAINLNAIKAFSGDRENPTMEDAAAVVESFFAQLDWDYTTPLSAVEVPLKKTRPIKLSVSET